MSKINPLIVTAVLVCVLAVAIYQNVSAKNSLKESSLFLANSEVAGKRLSVLKKVWNKNDLEAKVKSIFGENGVKDKGRVFEAKADSLSEQQLKDMVAKSLSETFEIEKISIVERSGSYSFVLDIVK